MFSSLRLSSDAMLDHRDPSTVGFEVGTSNGTGSSLNVELKSVSKNDSRISSARTTIRKLRGFTS